VYKGLISATISVAVTAGSHSTAAQLPSSLCPISICNYTYRLFNLLNFSHLMSVTVVPHL